jgi:hypothetical protein
MVGCTAVLELIPVDTKIEGDAQQGITLTKPMLPTFSSRGRC